MTSIINFINTGSNANSGDGDSLRTAFSKINLNFQSIIDNFIAAGVSSFNGQTGFVTFTSTDIVNVLGFEPYPSTNPLNFVTAESTGLVNYASLAYVDTTFVKNIDLTAYNYASLNYVDSKLTEYPTLVYLNNQGFITPVTLPDYITDYATKNYVANALAVQTSATNTAIFNAVSNSNLIPSQADIFTLGDEAYRWATLYLSNALYVQGIGISVDPVTAALYVNGNNILGNLSLTPTAVWNSTAYQNPGTSFSFSSSPPNQETGAIQKGFIIPSNEDSSSLIIKSAGVRIESTNSSIIIDGDETGIGIKLNGNVLLPTNYQAYKNTGTITNNILSITPNILAHHSSYDVEIPVMVQSQKDEQPSGNLSPLILKGSSVGLYATITKDPIDINQSTNLIIGGKSWSEGDLALDPLPMKNHLLLSEQGLFVGQTNNYGIPTQSLDSSTAFWDPQWAHFTGYTLPLTTGTVGQVLGITGFNTSTGLIVATTDWINQSGGGGGSSNQLLNSPYDVTLDVNGNTTFPSQTYIRQNNSYTRTVNGANISGAPTVIWTGTNDNITSVKMTIQIEGNETGDASGWHTQTCEAVIAERYWNNAGTLDPTMSVYGVVHTSVDPLATFTVQRNPTTHFIEVVATPTGTANGTLYPKVHSVELGTRD